ncbi:unnamed protein product [Rotaria sordida]|uniref:FLYWCH-type domain-containing protein n=2 Tax=Rotaria sordida TaxID=392033 RepID=A0A819RZR5_9BILA|nr:unnamed protein product [Rotaria sordida]
MTTPNEISFIVSQKGKKMLNINNFIFKLNKTTGTTKYYRCEDSRCTVTARTDLQDTLLNIKGDHCHPPEPEEIQIRTFKQVVKARAISESTPIPQIYDEEAARMDLSTLSIAALPSQRELSSTLNKARRLQTPPIPNSQLFDLPESYKKTLKNLPFLCIDQIIKRKTRILVFASNEQLKLLFNSSVILMDGTFSSSPPIFDQYFCFSQHLAAQLNMIFNPCTIMSDFEGTLAEVLKAEFPNSEHVGCFFHYTQSIYRNIQQLGLSSQYARDDEFRNTCRKLMALALMPISLVLQSYDDVHDGVLESSSTKFNLLKPLFTYFENQWIKNVGIEKWNVYGIQMRTNNNAEGGLTARPKTKKTLAIQHRIDTLYVRYNNGDVNANELLDGLSINNIHRGAGA